MPALPQSNIHLDILMGRDEALDVSDLFGGTWYKPVRIHLMPTTLLEGTENKPPMNIHGDMEKKLRI